jgi:hypothetical protein
MTVPSSKCWQQGGSVITGEDAGIFVALFAIVPAGGTSAANY